MLCRDRVWGLVHADTAGRRVTHGGGQAALAPDGGLQGRAGAAALVRWSADQKRVGTSLKHSSKSNHEENILHLIRSF